MDYSPTRAREFHGLSWASGSDRSPYVCNHSTHRKMHQINFSASRLSKGTPAKGKHDG